MKKNRRLEKLIENEDINLSLIYKEIIEKSNIFQEIKKIKQQIELPLIYTE